MIDKSTIQSVGDLVALILTRVRLCKNEQKVSRKWHRFSKKKTIVKILL